MREPDYLVKYVIYWDAWSTCDTMAWWKEDTPYDPLETLREIICSEYPKPRYFTISGFYVWDGEKYSRNHEIGREVLGGMFGAKDV